MQSKQHTVVRGDAALCIMLPCTSQRSVTLPGLHTIASFSYYVVWCIENICFCDKRETFIVRHEAWSKPLNAKPFRQISKRGLEQNRHQKFFNRGLYVCSGELTFNILKFDKHYRFIVLHNSIWWAWSKSPPVVTGLVWKPYTGRNLRQGFISGVKSSKTTRYWRCATTSKRLHQKLRGRTRETFALHWW